MMKHKNKQACDNWTPVSDLPSPPQACQLTWSPALKQANWRVCPVTPASSKFIFAGSSGKTFNDTKFAVTTESKRAALSLNRVTATITR